MKHDVIVAQRTRLYESAGERSSWDSAFRAKLVADPAATLNAFAQELGLEARVPESLGIEVLESTWDKLYLVLPPAAEPPLSDTELERVVGGISLIGSASIDSDAHGCPACPHPCVGPAFSRMR
jgi:hypothetical protein